MGAAGKLKSEAERKIHCDKYITKGKGTPTFPKGFFDKIIGTPLYAELQQKHANMDAVEKPGTVIDHEKLMKRLDEEMAKRTFRNNGVGVELKTAQLFVDAMNQASDE